MATTLAAGTAAQGSLTGPISVRSHRVGRSSRTSQRTNEAVDGVGPVNTATQSKAQLVDMGKRMGKLKRLAQPIGVILDQVPTRVFIETGTFLGESVEFALDLPFRAWHSVELSEELHEAAQARFSNVPDLALHRGDSAVVIPEILEDLREPAVFWLDAHYCFLDTARGPKDCPLVEEVEAIARHEQDTGLEHVVLVDDYHILGTSSSSPWLVSDDVVFIPEADWSEVTPELISSILGASGRKQLHVWGDALFALPPGVDVAKVVVPPDPYVAAQAITDVDSE